MAINVTGRRCDLSAFFCCTKQINDCRHFQPGYHNCAVCRAVSFLEITARAANPHLRVCPLPARLVSRDKPTPHSQASNPPHLQAHPARSARHLLRRDQFQGTRTSVRLYSMSCSLAKTKRTRVTIDVSSACTWTSSSTPLGKSAQVAQTTPRREPAAALVVWRFHPQVLGAGGRLHRELVCDHVWIE